MSTRPRHVVGRTADEPTADLTEHRVIHRAIRVDLERLASVSAELAESRAGCADARRRAFGDYLHPLAAAIESHLNVDDDHLAALLATVTGERQPPPAPDGRVLVRLLHRATAMVGGVDAAVQPFGEHLPTLLADADRIATRLTRDQEDTVFPVIRRYVRAVDYQWMQEEFRADLPPGLLAFFVPWTLRHATERERPRLLDPAMDVTQRIFAQRFEARETLVFGHRPG
jgi:hypothetical protein